LEINAGDGNNTFNVENGVRMTSVAVSFTPSSSSVQDNQIIFAANHNLTANQAVVYHQGSGNGSIGLDDGQTYYVTLVTGTPKAIQLALTPGGASIPLSAPAVSSTAVDRLAPVGHTLVINGGAGDDSAYVDCNGVSIIARGNLGQTVTNVTFSRDDADSGNAGHTPLDPGTYYV